LFNNARHIDRGWGDRNLRTVFMRRSGGVLWTLTWK